MPDISTAQPAPAPPAPTSTTQKRRTAGPVAAVVVAVLFVIGLMNSGEDEPADTADQRPAVAAEPEAGLDPASVPEPVAPAPAVAVAEAVMPDVVGMNHQLAQDTLQASGFYLLLEEDATGAGRLLIRDRNWEVVAQSVVAGSRVGIDTPITLFAEKGW